MTQDPDTNAKGNSFSGHQAEGTDSTSAFNDRIRELTAKCYFSECDEDEQNELNEWISRSIENKNSYEETIELLSDTRNALSLIDINRKSAFDKVIEQIEENKIIDLKKAKRVKRISVYWRVAASVVLLIAIGIAYLTLEDHTPANITITTAYNEIKEITLPDGSDIVINGGSVIKYPKNFNAQTRTLTMTGEAFFTVTPDKEHPFIINTGLFKVKVLGTSFNVKAYKNHSDAGVVVETGTVNVTTGSSSVIITKGESAMLDKKNMSLNKSRNRDVNYKAWKTKQIRFVNTPLVKAVSTLENVYKVQIETDSNILKDKRINADFDKQSIDFILNTICETYHFSCTKNGDKYIITGKN